MSPDTVFGSNEKPQKPDSSINKLNIGRSALIVLIVALSLVGLYFVSTYSYPLFHSIVEVFSLVIAFIIFAVAWNTRRIIDNHYFLFVGIAFLFVAALGLFHTLTYKGMGVFPDLSDPNWATQLWIADRYLLSISLLVPLLFLKRKIKSGTIIAIYSVVTTLLLVSIFVWQNFPLAYDIATESLTPFKVISEFVISLIILAAIGLLFKKRREFNKDIYRLLLAAMFLAIATEMAFTLYTDGFVIANLTGHLLNVLSFYFIYRALIETTLTKPFELLFRNLKQSETNLAIRANELTVVNKKLEEEIAQREATQRALEESQERLQLKLDSVLSPEVELGEQDLANIIDVPSLQATMDYLYSVTHMGFALIDLKGKVLVGTGWQDICIKFNRFNLETCRDCVEVDVELSNGAGKGEIRFYKCKNNMWDVVNPLYIGDKKVGNVFFGQFFFDDEVPDRKMFESQAEKYGYDKAEYLATFDRIPRFSRKNIQDLMVFYSRLAEVFSKLSLSNLRLAKSLENQKQLQGELEEKTGEIREYASQMETLAQERAKQLKDAERLSAIGATAGMVGHDIRNPLQAITCELYLQNKEVESLPESKTKNVLQDGIRNIEDNILYINKIVADLQDFAKPLNPKKEKVEVEKTINEALAMVKFPEDIKLTIRGLEKKLTLTADSAMLKRVLVNLTQNAVQAMPDGGDLILIVTKRRSQVEISVEDTGKGIPKDIQTKVFTPLMTTKAKGQGFGLAVVKRITEAMEGTVTFDSEEGKGTKFILRFPA